MCIRDRYKVVVSSCIVNFWIFVLTYFIALFSPPHSHSSKCSTQLLGCRSFLHSLISKSDHSGICPVICISKSNIFPSFLHWCPSLLRCLSVLFIRFSDRFQILNCKAALELKWVYYVYLQQNSFAHVIIDGEIEAFYFFY